MQIIKTSHSAVFSAAFTLAMLTECATKYCGMSEVAVTKLSKQVLSKVTNGNTRTGPGAKSGVGDLEFSKLRTVIVQKLHDSQDYGDAFKTNDLELEYTCLPDLDIGKAGANKASGKTRASASKLQGAYTITDKGRAALAAVRNSDPGRWNIVQHILANNDFAAYVATAPAKEVKKVGAVTTSAAEMSYSMRSGWVKAATL
jgi:hypothetical protein